VEAEETKATVSSGGSSGREVAERRSVIGLAPWSVLLLVVVVVVVVGADGSSSLASPAVRPPGPPSPGRGGPESDRCWAALRDSVCVDRWPWRRVTARETHCVQTLPLHHVSVVMTAQLWNVFYSFFLKMLSSPVKVHHRASAQPA